MAKILKGSEVTSVMNEKLKVETEALKQEGIMPTLAIVRVGDNSADISYERGASKRCETIGISVKNFVLPPDVTQDELLSVIMQINNDAGIHGCLMFRPLPKHIDENLVRNTLVPEKDIDGITDASLAGVFSGTGTGFPPCTAQACMETLDHFGYELKGKKVTVIGRSLVVGKPLAMLLLGRHATVTMCHTRTLDMPSICRDAEILIVAAGRAGIADKNFFNPTQIVIDVGINTDDDGKLCGDVVWEDVQMAAAATPVPGGVGTVTTSVLAKHVIEAAKRACGSADR
jgi:methylenetetrahydrofolate dehydrogenase (NADP+)/methenyltetrahydrofolate cyclohydrolase